MRISISKFYVGLAFLCMVPTTGFTEERSYLCAINEVYECVAVTGCSRISLEDANLTGIMLLDLEKKQLSIAPLGQDPSTEDIEGVTVTDEAILLHGIGKKGRTAYAIRTILSAASAKIDRRAILEILE